MNGLSYKMTTHKWLGRKKKKTTLGTKDPFEEGERREWKSWIKTQYENKQTQSKNKIMELVSSF